LYKEVAKIKMGTITEDAIGIADKAAQKLSTIHYYSRSDIIQYQLLRARIYHALDREAEAWDVVNELFEETKKDINPYLWTYILTTMIDLAIDDGATHPELENWMILALNNERLKGNKFGELPLYEKYAIFLLLQGRYAEAIKIQQEALRLTKTMNLFERADKNKITLDHIISLQAAQPNQQTRKPTAISDPKTPEEQPAKTGITTPSSSTKTTPRKTSGGSTTTKQRANIDIQPYESMAIAVEGQAAFGRFYIFNPTATAQNGSLRFSGAIEEINWLNDSWMSIGSSSELPSTQKEESLSVPAGAYCIVDLTGIPESSGKESVIQCEWIPDETDRQQTAATWIYSTALNDTRTAVIDVHAICENPFYLIPIHHMIQRVATGATETVDFTVEASAPMRIEIYNAETDQLISIDANGDGDFKDTGDFIGTDKNRNNWPDISFKSDQKLTSLVMYIRPADQANDSEAELTVKVLDNNQWRIDAVDLIEFNMN
ncbi:MAG: hypothetical protein OES84_01820, partial [Kiritimatiellaceae bacterium]|nr:hypothetical protein [Kiritimatiellaceae bacterium]